MHTKITSRRAILGGAAALATGAAVNVAATVATRSAAAAAASDGNADAELLALGRTLDGMIERHRALGAECDRLGYAGYSVRHTELMQEYRERRRILAARHLGGPTHPEEIEEDERLMSRLEQLQREWGMDVLLEGQEAVTDAMDPIQRAIVAAPATTVVGLAVKARCTAFWCSHYWDASDGDCDVPERHARDLIEAVLALAERSGVQS